MLLRTARNMRVLWHWGTKRFNKYMNHRLKPSRHFCWKTGRTWPNHNIIPHMSKENLILGKQVCPRNSHVLNKAAAAKSFRSCPTLWDPRNGSPPGSFVHGIFQARVLEWGAIEQGRVNKTALGLTILGPLICLKCFGKIENIFLKLFIFFQYWLLLLKKMWSYLRTFNRTEYF